MTHLRPARGRCSHRLYGLSCEQFDDLFARANGRCEICDVRGEDTPWGRLHVDHVGPYTPEARIRGLLCSVCNTRLGRPKSYWRFPDPDRVTAYLAKPLIPGAGYVRGPYGRHPRAHEPASA